MIVVFSIAVGSLLLIVFYVAVLETNACCIGSVGVSQQGTGSNECYLFDLGHGIKNNGFFGEIRYWKHSDYQWYYLEAVLAEIH